MSPLLQLLTGVSRGLRQRELDEERRKEQATIELLRQTQMRQSEQAIKASQQAIERGKQTEERLRAEAAERQRQFDEREARLTEQYDATQDRLAASEEAAERRHGEGMAWQRERFYAGREEEKEPQPGQAAMDLERKFKDIQMVPGAVGIISNFARPGVAITPQQYEDAAEMFSRALGYEVTAREVWAMVQKAEEEEDLTRQFDEYLKAQGMQR